ncbi:carboxypeptidase regulatory-like domain-containing protein [Candidatus Parcubacteria bacterium]|nr:MAG: carboxypeptidase regulatory-like domain-containing protein [Candidatus Parcubacteria bacterium]
MPRGRGDKGATLIDTIVGTALILLVFIGITGAFQLSLDVVTNNRVRAGAIALLNERMEYLRSLSYTQIGVEGGIPAGIVPQIEVVSWNAIDYTRRTSVMYSDDPEDGLGVDDENDIIADYKTIRVEVSWQSKQGERSVTLLGRVSPHGVEVAVPGGILTINVVDADAQPMPDAQVDISNTGTSPAINIRTYTNENGQISFIGAPAASNYQITVSRPGYSTAQTYAVSVQNPDPDPRHLTVADNQTTSATFAIDVVSTKTVETYRLYEEDEWEDTFSTADFVAVASGVEVGGGSVYFAGEAPYPSSGSLRSTTIAPSQLIGWNAVSWTDSTPAQTNILYRVYTGSDVLIPDSDLPGNSAGFSTSPIDISGLSSVTYPSLRLDAEFATTDENQSPLLEAWNVSYDYGPIALPNTPFSMRGSKTIGNNPTVYKYNQTHNSGAGASVTLSSIEWDTYELSIATTTGYNLAESCNPQPEALSPGSSQTSRLYVLPYTPHTLLVDVRSGGGQLIAGASVRLSDGAGYDETFPTSACGQVFFPDLTAGVYSMTVTADGYQSYSNSNVNVFDVSEFSAVLTSL